MPHHISPLSRYRRGVKPTPGHDHNAEPIPAALTLPDGVTISRTALVCPEQLPIDQWKSLGCTLRQLEGSVQWWIGDWWHYGFHHYGDRKAIATANDTFPRGPAFGTLMNYGWVAGKVETSRRREVLSFSHHVVVAPLEPEEQERWLNVAIEGKLSVAKLEQKMLEDKIGGPPTVEEQYWRYLSQLENAAQVSPRLTFTPPWKWTNLEDYLEHYFENYSKRHHGDRHPNWLDRPYHPPDLTSLAKAMMEAITFWTETLEFLRRIQKKVREKAADDENRVAAKTVDDGASTEVVAGVWAAVEQVRSGRPARSPLRTRANACNWGETEVEPPIEREGDQDEV